MPRIGLILMPWLNRKIVDPLIQILRRGAEPNQLAFSAALGITLGIFPICGVTVLLCGIAIAILGNLCHAPTLMLANFVATPIELSLVVPFLRFGEVISGSNHFPLTSDALRKVVTGQASREVLFSIFHALLGWLIAAPFILGILYVVFRPCFKYLLHKFSAVPSSPMHPLPHPNQMTVMSPPLHHCPIKRRETPVSNGACPEQILALQEKHITKQQWYVFKGNWNRQWPSSNNFISLTNIFKNQE